MGAGSSKPPPGERRVRRSKSWAVEDSSKIVNRPLSNSFRLQLRCALHELGTQRGCRIENYLQQRGYGALVGLHSNWIGHFILASARLSNRLLEEHHLIYQLHSQRIGAVINLQVPGEHAGCGDGVLQDSGFSYTPERLMENGVFYYNFPMEDSKHFDPNYMLDICHVIDSQIAREEKVLEYAAAGCARSWYTATRDVDGQGLSSDATFCILVHMKIPWRRCTQYRLTGETRWPYFSSIRHWDGTFTNIHQIMNVKNFNVYLQKLRIFFVSPDKYKKRHLDSPGYPNIPEQMSRQKRLLHGVERRALLYIPKIIDWTTRELIRRTDFNRQRREKLAAAFMRAFITPRGNVDISKAKEKINTADWGGAEEVEVSVLCNLLLEWLIQLQEPIVPDAIVTTALGRSDIESAIDELSKADKSSFATIQILACFIFQIVPVKAKLIRQLYSALAHVLLTHSTLQDTKWEEVISEEAQATAEKGRAKAPIVSKNRRLSNNDVYTKFKPTLIEIEYGLLLEASARFWIKLGKTTYDPQETLRKSVSPSSSSQSPPSPENQKQTLFSQPWFRDRASLQYEQYNPLADALQHQKDMETPSGTSSTPSQASSFAESSSPTSPGRH